MRLREALNEADRRSARGGADQWVVEVAPEGYRVCTGDEVPARGPTRGDAWVFGRYRRGAFHVSEPPAQPAPGTRV